MRILVDTSAYSAFMRGHPELKLALQRAEEIYLIGYRAVDEAMSEMFESLREGVKLHVIGMGGAGQIAQRLLREQPHLREGTVYEDGFWAFINDY